MLALRLATLAALIAPALADVVPTSPSGNTVVQVGQDIQAMWSADTTGQWTDVEIQLMTGDNYQVRPGRAVMGDETCADSRWFLLRVRRCGDETNSARARQLTNSARDGRRRNDRDQPQHPLPGRFAVLQDLLFAVVSCARPVRDYTPFGKENGADGRWRRER
jgi:hypothetical protein